MASYKIILRNGETNAILEEIEFETNGHALAREYFAEVMSTSDLHYSEQIVLGKLNRVKKWSDPHSINASRGRTYSDTLQEAIFYFSNSIDSLLIHDNYKRGQNRVREHLQRAKHIYANWSMYE